MKVLLGSTLVLSVFFASLFSPAPASGQDDPLLQDAEHYAATYEVELDEALLRLRLQPAIGRLNADLTESEAATFAGLWVQHEPGYRIIIQFTGRGSSRLEKLLQSEEYQDLYPFVEVRSARRSLRSLAAVQAASHRAARAQGVPMESSIKVQENRVELFTTRPDHLAVVLRATDKARAAAGATPLLDDAVIVEVERLSSPARYLNGGQNLSTCTSGFAVQDGSGTKGVITAGHCNNSLPFNTRNLQFQSEAFSGSQDVQWHTPPALPELYVVNRIWDGLFDTSTPYYRFITATKPRAQQFIGESVCKYGITSGATCGTISSTTFAPGYVPGAAATFIVVTSATQDQSEPGDSGGPWYSGSTAYGIMSGHFTGNFDAIYMAIDYSSALGVSVLTTTPTLNLARFTFRDMGENVNAYTEINSNDYECGVAGVAARDGDVQESGGGTIIQSYLTKTNNHFDLRADFRTHNDHESWDVDLLCLKKSVYSVSRFQYTNLGDNFNYNTGLSTGTYECGIGGMAALDGDVEENGSGDIIETYMYPSGGSWWIRGNFRSHLNHESWNIDALCVNKSHPVVRYEFRNIGDNVSNYDTFVSDSTYECGIAGMAARDADIFENDDGDIINAYLYASGGSYKIRADFFSHNNHESWDIDLLCIQR